MAEPVKGRGGAPAGKVLSAEQVRAEPGTGEGSANGEGFALFQVVSRFNRLRQDQRGLASKAAELELELNEHSLVIETLREVDPTRKCFRMVGGVLVERTVKEVLPALESNREQISKLLEALAQQLQAKGRELSEFRERHNIRLLGEEEPRAPREGSEGSKGGPGGVLVS
uniref:Prefoldin subunit 2 n=1 Tax=Catharus ustulatus TaxID=91951 RepID=A0A8C3UNN7_CATUS